MGAHEHIDSHPYVYENIFSSMPTAPARDTNDTMYAINSHNFILHDQFWENQNT